MIKIYDDAAAKSAHSGIAKNLHKIKTRHFYLSLYKDSDDYIKSCIPCAQYDSCRQKAPGTLRPMNRRECL